MSFAAALLIAWRAEDLAHGIALGMVAAVGIAAGWIDAYDRRLPDALVLPAYPAVGVFVLATGDADTMLRAVVCAAASMAVYGIGCVAGHLGPGDVKLAGLLGLVLGWAAWQTAAVAIAAAVVIGGVQAVVVLALRRKEFPFGPAMLFGAGAAVAIAPFLAS
ncbi:MAG TPA: prepilin peptidase [Glycomyces sp.]|nr:prepilin peptidase [Glycomyces sp.]